MALNHAIEQMDQRAPFGLPSPLIQVPEIPKERFILNNIKVDRSVVGSINTGNVESIDVSITQLRGAGDERLSEALKVLTEAIANETSLGEADKHHLLDQVAFLSEQAVAAAKDRRPGVIRSALKSIQEAATTVSVLSSAWQAARPLLDACFGVRT